jgi:hypothetical protein
MAEILKFTSLARRVHVLTQPGVDQGQETLEDVTGDFGKDKNNFIVYYVTAEVAVDG